MKVSLNILAVSAVLLVIAGCAATSQIESKEHSNERIISERAVARWQHLIKGDFESAYGYLSPAFRSSTSLRDYRARFKAGLWTGAEVKSVTCRETEVCQVEMEIEYRYVARSAGPVAGKRILQETWRKDAGEWWNVPELR